MKIKTELLVSNAMIAALYAVLTLSLAPISYGALQFRLSEIMTLIAFFNPNLIFGLTVGCFIANLFSPLGIVDVIFGTTATFLALFTMRYTKNIFTASLMPVVYNGIIIGLELYLIENVPFIAGFLSVAAGEFVVVSIIGVCVFTLLKNTALLKN